MALKNTKKVKNQEKRECVMTGESYNKCGFNSQLNKTFYICSIITGKR